MLKVHKDIIAALAYFDMFGYALTRTEIYLHLPGVHKRWEIDIALRYLVAKHAIYRIDAIYSLRNDDTVPKRRSEHEEKVYKQLTKANKLSRLLGGLPFIRGVALPGLLSRHSANRAELQLFIITETNRVWIASLLLRVVRLLFAYGKKHRFSVNCCVDHSQLEVKEKNIYTATEIVNLVPLYGDATFSQFFAANNWTTKFLPNNYLRVVSALPANGKVIETLFNNRLGDVIDKWLMCVFQQKEPKNNLGDLVTGRHFIKPNPFNFQPLLLHSYTVKLAQLVEGYESSMVY